MYNKVLMRGKGAECGGWVGNWEGSAKFLIILPCSGL